jgi:Fur family iron response transcriptional regulator
MPKRDETSVLRDHGINPSAQRVAVAQYVLHTDEHPSADEVWTRVRERFPQVSRATVYNTLHLFVEKGLLRQFALTEGRVVFDPKTSDHHHFIDDDSGKIHDVPWDAIRVSDVASLDGFEVREYQVVMRGKRNRNRNKS